MHLPRRWQKTIYNQERPPGKLAAQNRRSDSSGLKSFLIVNVPAKVAEEFMMSSAQL